MRWDFFTDKWNWTFGFVYSPENAAVMFTIGPFCFVRHMGDE